MSDHQSDSEDWVRQVFTNCSFQKGEKVIGADEVIFVDCTGSPLIEGVLIVRYDGKAPSEILYPIPGVIFCGITFQGRLRFPHIPSIVFRRCRFEKVVLEVGESASVELNDCESYPSSGKVFTLVDKSVTQSKLQSLEVENLYCSRLSSLNDLQQLSCLSLDEDVEERDILLILKATNLTTLVIYGNASEQSLRQLAQLPRLEKLSYYGDSEKRQGWLEAWKDHPTLYSLDAQLNRYGVAQVYQMSRLTFVNEGSGSEVSRFAQGNRRRYQRKLFTLIAILMGLYL